MLEFVRYTNFVVVIIIIIIIGHSAKWDVTVGNTLAASYVAQSAVQAGKAAEIAAERKFAKYSGLSSSHILFRWLSSLLAHWRTTLIVLLQRLAEG